MYTNTNKRTHTYKPTYFYGYPFMKYISAKTQTSESIDENIHESIWKFSKVFITCI